MEYPRYPIKCYIRFNQARNYLLRKNIRELAPEDRRVIEQLIRDQEEKIESLTQEIETLKQQRTVNP